MKDSSFSFIVHFMGKNLHSSCHRTLFSAFVTEKKECHYANFAKTCPSLSTAIAFFSKHFGQSRTLDGNPLRLVV